MTAPERETAEAERHRSHLERLASIEDTCYFLAGDLHRAGLGGLALRAESLGEEVAIEHDRLKASKAGGDD
jgi:hypothetical protein